MTLTPQQVYDAYRKDPNHDMHPYSEFLRMNARGNILEIGVRGGVSTAAFLLGIEKNGGHLFSVDIKPECGKLFEHRQWTFIWADSHDRQRVCMSMAVEKVDWPTEGEWDFEILLIDGDHSREGVRSDLENYALMVRRGGLILVHDIFGTAGGATPEQIAQDWPTEAVGEEYHAFADERGWPTFDLPGQFGMGIIVRI